MSKNIDQVFIANPITTNQANDLMYFGRSPYGASDDTAMLYSNFAAQFGAPYTAAALTRTDDTNVTLTLGGTPATALLHAVSLTLGWSGSLAVGRGGLGVTTTPANGQIPIGNGTNYTVATITAGTGISVTNGAGTITIAASGGSSPWSAGAGANSAIGGDGSTAATGTNSLAYGSTNTATAGNSAVAFGDNCQANGDYSLAFGQNCKTNGQPYTFAGGLGCTAEANYAFAYGQGVDVFGQHSVGMGQSVTVGGARSFAFGYSASCPFDGSFVICDGSGNGNHRTANNQFNAYYSGGFNFGMYLASAGALVEILQIDATANTITKYGLADQSFSLQAPTTGFSITIADGVQRLVLNPAGTLATGTVVMPATPINGQLIFISSSETITALTLSANAGQTMFANAPTTLVAAGSIGLIYDLGSTTWLPTA